MINDTQTIDTGKRRPRSAIIGHHTDGRPILAGRFGRRVGGDHRLLIIDCPRCGRANCHGWADSVPLDVPQPRTADCRCWNAAPSGYYIVPAVEPCTITTKDRLQLAVASAHHRLRLGLAIGRNDLDTLIDAAQRLLEASA